VTVPTTSIQGPFPGWAVRPDQVLLAVPRRGWNRARTAGFRVYIHETADVAAAERFWLNVTAADPSQFRKAVLKTHNPRTIRKNVGADYHGCLRIDVRQCAELYRRIEGWVRAAISPAQYR
jgi:hypothetical protein